MSIVTTCKTIIIFGAGLLSAINPLKMWLAIMRRDAFRGKKGGDIAALNASAVEELDNPSIPHTRERIAQYYASYGRYLTYAEIDEFTHYARYYVASSIDYSNQKVVPYVMGEYTGTGLREVYVANDNRLRGMQGNWHNKRGQKREDEDVTEERQRKKDEAIAKVLDTALEQIAELTGKGRFGTIKYSKKKNVIKNLKIIFRIIRNITKNNGGYRV